MCVPISNLGVLQVFGIRVLGSFAIILVISWFKVAVWDQTGVFEFLEDEFTVV